MKGGGKEVRHERRKERKEERERKRGVDGVVVSEK